MLVPSEHRGNGIATPQNEPLIELVLLRITPPPPPHPTPPYLSIYDIYWLRNADYVRK